MLKLILSYYKEGLAALEKGAEFGPLAALPVREADRTFQVCGRGKCGYGVCPRSERTADIRTGADQ